MQPLKIIIQGDFWDCQIYRGRLYLWYTDGSVGVYNWDSLVKETFKNKVDQLVLQCAFIEGDLLYKEGIALIFKDLEIKNVLLEKFKKTFEKELLIDLEQLKNFEYSKQDNPVAELPTDTCIYNNTLFTITDLGIYSSSIHSRKTKYGISTRANRLWDCPLISVKAAHNSLALAGGDQGVFELHLDDYNDFPNLKKIDKKIYQVSEAHSSLVNWSFASLYSSSYIETSFLAAFGWEQEQKTERKEHKRRFKKIIPDSKILKNSDFSWGSQEKIYLANSNTINVFKYVQSNVNLKDENQTFQFLETIPLTESKGEIISGGIAYFGVIIEFNDALSVLSSNGDSLFTFPEAVARWRIYPRSKRYENHLHVIYEDRLVIYSFNHDYFIKQESKTRGIKYSQSSSQLFPKTN